jgi:hypothetical protein
MVEEWEKDTAKHTLSQMTIAGEVGAIHELPLRDFRAVFLLPELFANPWYLQ